MRLPAPGHLIYTAAMRRDLPDPIASDSLHEAARIEGEAQPIDEGAEAAEPRNFLVLTAYQAILRTGWIFKTESIIMPAVLDTLAGAAWVRGWLPLLNRLGQSVVPVFTARRLKLIPKKKWSLTTSTAAMAALLVAMAFLCGREDIASKRWAAPAYLLVYALFFAFLGSNQLAIGALQGKLIRATRRGRLLLVSNVLGGTTAVLCALGLLSFWLHERSGEFGKIFGFSAALFAVAAVSAWFLDERADAFHEPRSNPWRLAAGIWRTLRGDANLRRLAIVTSLFGTSIVLVPHYQNVGLADLDMGMKSLMWWVVVQNVGTALFSIPAGPMADRFGNRVVMQCNMLGIAAAPLVAVVLMHVGSNGRHLFHVVFALLGLMPVAMRTFNNYVLEISTPEHHVHYLSILGLCMAGPAFLSPLAGLMIDTAGVTSVFVTVALLILVGWLLSFGLVEPRRHRFSR